MSHDAGGAPVARGTQRSIDALRSHVEALTGYRPHGCPWRSLYRPIVAQAMDAVSLAREGFADGGLGPDPLGIVEDATRVYVRAFNRATFAMDRKAAEEARKEAERRRRRAAAKPHGRRR